LSAEHKENPVAALQSFPVGYEEKGDDFLDWLTDWQEMKCGCVTIHLRLSRNQCNGTTSIPHQRKKFRTSTSMTKIMATVFWERKGALSRWFPALRRQHRCCCILWELQNITLSNSKQMARNADMRSLPAER
jgi:hypothetical protein